MYEISVESTISASHHLRGYQGKCEKVHGHNWRVEACVSSELLDETGLVMDFGDLRRALNQSLEDFDHADLNAQPVFADCNPSSENMARIVFERLARIVDNESLKLTRVRVWETEGSCASYTKS